MDSELDDLQKSELTTELTGQVLDGKYLVENFVAEGAMGRVYRGRHLAMERDVAIKTLHLHLLKNQDAVERFKREVVVSASLAHPGIVRVYSSGATPSGEPYLAMDFIQGESLATILKNGKLPLPRFFTLFKKIVDALAYAHEKGIVHRDLKPGNILVSSGSGEESPVIVDFGIARAIEESSDQKVTQTGALVGTSAYMSPEQCTTGIVDARSDIYSLGCVMYECLIGDAPFAGESALDVMFKHLHLSISGLGGLQKLPKILADVIVKCLAKSPASRYQSAADLQAALAACERQSAGLRYRIFVSRKIQAVVAGGVLIAGLFSSVLYFAISKPSTSGIVEEKPPESGQTIAFSRGANALISMCDQYLTYQNSHPLKMFFAEQEIMYLCRRRLDRYQDDKAAREGLSRVEYRYAAACLQCGKLDDALKYVDRSIQHASDKKEELHSRLLKGSIYQALSRNKEAASEFEKVAKLCDPPGPGTFDIYLNAVHSLGEEMQNEGDVTQAMKWFEKEKALKASADQWNVRDSMHCRTALVKALASSGKTAAAEKLLDESLGLVVDADGKMDLESAHILNSFSVVCWRLGLNEKAIKLASDSAQLFERLGKPANAVVPVRALSRWYMTLGRADKAEALLLEFIRRHDHEPGVFVPAQMTLCDVYGEEGKHEQRLELARKVMAVPNVSNQDFQTAAFSAAVALWSLGRKEEAEKFIEDLKDDSKGPLFSAWRHSALGFIYGISDKDHLAVKEYKECLAILKGLPPDLNRQLALIDAYLRASLCYSKIYESKESEKMAKLCIATTAGLPHSWPTRVEAMMQLIRLQAGQGRIAEAQEVERQLSENFVGHDTRESLQGLIQLTDAQIMCGLYKKAQSTSTRSMAIAEKLKQLRQGKEFLLVIERQRAQIAAAQGDRQKALQSYKEVIQKWVKLQNGYSRESLAAMDMISNLEYTGKNWEEAIAWKRKLIDNLPAVSGTSGEKTCHLAGLFNILQNSGNLKEAEQVLREAVAVKQSDVPGYFQNGEAQKNLAIFLGSQKRYDEVDSLMRGAVQSFRKPSRPRHIADAEAHYARLLLDQKRYSEAVAALIRACEAALEVGDDLRTDQERYVEEAKKIRKDHHVEGFGDSLEKLEKQIKSQCPNS